MSELLKRKIRLKMHQPRDVMQARQGAFGLAVIRTVGPSFGGPSEHDSSCSLMIRHGGFEGMASRNRLGLAFGNLSFLERRQVHLAGPLAHAFQSVGQSLVRLTLRGVYGLLCECHRAQTNSRWRSSQSLTEDSMVDKRSVPFTGCFSATVIWKRKREWPTLAKASADYRFRLVGRG